MRAEKKKKQPLKYVERTWKEIEKYCTSDVRLIVPIGAIEQHGFHLPLNTDTLIAEYICNKLSAGLGIMVAPTFEYTFCNAGRCFPGTISPDFDLVKGFFRNLLESYLKQGFENIFVITGHGSRTNLAGLKVAGIEAAEERGGDIHVIFHDNLGIKGVWESEFHHACEGETSLISYIAPHLVRKGKLTKGEPAKTGFSVFRKFDDGQSGVWGDPFKYSPEKGRQYLEEVHLRLTAYIRRVS